MKIHMLATTVVVTCAIAFQINAQSYQTQNEDDAAKQQAQPKLSEPAGAERTDASKSAAMTQTDQVRENFYLGPKFNDLPAAVQNTIKQQSQGQVIDDIDRETWEGKSVYEVEFEQEGGNREIHVADNGSMVTINEAAGAQPSNTNQVTTPDLP